MSERIKKWLSIGLVVFLSCAFLVVSISTNVVVKRYKTLQKSRQELNESYISLQLQYDQKDKDYKEIKKLYDELASKQEQINAELFKVQNYDTLQQQLTALQKTYAELEKKNIATEQQFKSLQAQYDSLFASFELLKNSVNKELLIQNILPGIVCFGDSLTVGNTGNNGTSYPSEVSNYLQSMLGTSVSVINEGRGGWSSEQLYYQEPAQIKKEGWGNRIFIVWMGINGGWEVSNTKTVTLTDENGNVLYDENFEPITETVKVVDETASIQKLIYQIKYILSCQTDPSARYLVVGLSRPTGIVPAEVLEDAMEREFGDKFFNIRERLISDGLKDAGLQLTAKDQEWLAIGRPPASLMGRSEGGVYDPTHFNDTGYRLIGKYIFEKLDGLGYFDTAKSVSSWYK